MICITNGISNNKVYQLQMTLTQLRIGHTQNRKRVHLDLHLQSDDGWSNHISGVYEKAYKRLNTLGKISNAPPSISFIVLDLNAIKID